MTFLAGFLRSSGASRLSRLGKPRLAESALDVEIVGQLLAER